MIAAPGVTDALLSRDFKHLLIVRQTRVLTPATTPTKQDANAPGELSVTWWNIRTRRERELWRCDLKPGESGHLWLGDWFATSNTVALRFWKGTDLRILLLKPALGEAKEVPLPPTADASPRPSPTQNYAALVDPAGSCEKEIHFFDANGKIGDAIALPGTVWFQGWSDDGTAFLGSARIKEGEDKYRDQWYAVNPARRTVTPIPTPPLDANGYRISEARPDPADALPLCLTEDFAGIVRVEALPLAKDAERPSVQLSRDARAAFLLPDGSMAFFWRDGALYAAPIVSTVSPPVATDKPAREH